MKVCKKKKKPIGIIVVSAAVLSVGSVGFASWIISGGDSESVSAICVNVATISDERITLTDFTYTDTCEAGTGNDSTKTLVDKSTDQTTAYIVFGPKSSDTTGLIQASGNGPNDVEHMSVSFIFTMSCGGLNDTLVRRLNQIYITPTYPQILTDLASNSNNYIYNPSSTSGDRVTLYEASTAADGNKYGGNAPVKNSVSGTNTGNFTISIGAATNGKATVVITANWKWGSTFSGDNPGSLDTSESQANSVISQLYTMNSMVGDSTTYPDKNVRFLVEVTANNTETTSS